GLGCRRRLSGRRLRTRLTLPLGCRSGGRGLRRGFLRLAPCLLLSLAARTLFRLLTLALEPRSFLLGPENTVALSDDVADRFGDRSARADRVVVAWDHEVDPVRVAVGVDETDDRDPQTLGLADGDRLCLQVDYEYRVRDA